VVISGLLFIVSLSGLTRCRLSSLVFVRTSCLLFGLSGRYLDGYSLFKKLVVSSTCSGFVYFYLIISLNKERCKLLHGRNRILVDAYSDYAVARQRCPISRDTTLISQHTHPLRAIPTCRAIAICQHYFSALRTRITPILFPATAKSTSATWQT
jgi:hypothetical protein